MIAFLYWKTPTSGLTARWKCKKWKLTLSTTHFTNTCKPAQSAYQPQTKQRSAALKLINDYLTSLLFTQSFIDKSTVANELFKHKAVLVVNFEAEIYDGSCPLMKSYCVLGLEAFSLEVVIEPQWRVEDVMWAHVTGAHPLEDGV